MWDVGPMIILVCFYKSMMAAPGSCESVAYSPGASRLHPASEKKYEKGSKIGCTKPVNPVPCHL